MNVTKFDSRSLISVCSCLLCQVSRELLFYFCFHLKAAGCSMSKVFALHGQGSMCVQM